MKKLVAILFLSVAFISCKDDSQKEVSVDSVQEEIGVRELSGNFVYYADAAVLQTKSELFGIIENEQSQELIKKAQPLKNEATDEVEVAVTLKVKVSKKPEGEEGWENRVEIVDIIKVSKINPEDSDMIKLGTKD